MRLAIDDWDKEVGLPLSLIKIRSRRIRSDAKALADGVGTMTKFPNFETEAESLLREAAALLNEAIDKINALPRVS